ncbi:TPA: replication endonuclease [Shewanella algae]|nr:replication endonuclease [Shewanella algae]
MDIQQFERQAGVSIPAIFATAKAQNDLKHAQRHLERLPDDVAATMFREYIGRWRRNERSANMWMRDRSAAIKEMLTQFPLPIWHINTEIRRAAIATEWADRCQRLLNNATQFGQQQVDAKELLNIVKQPADQWGFCPVLPSFKNYDSKKDCGQFDRDPAMYNMIAAAIARLVDEAWWGRQLEKSWRRYQEHAAIITGRVRAGVSPYVSAQSLREYKQRKQAAGAWLHSNFVINETHGLELLLADAVGASVANPEVRRAELMVRMRGFEDYAEENGYVGEFYTWTAPSRFHSWKKSKKGPSYANSHYLGANPKDTQAYLCQQWAKTRSKLAREDVDFFGFRVVEPHHDGTPHWHLLLFVKPSQLRLLRSIMRSYALEHDKHDLAPAKGKRRPRFSGYRPRFDFKTIDPQKGSATGYIAKYIAKNIDGAYVADDWEAESSGSHGAEGVTAWASTWGIRQFQQIGGPSVTVWRELRRLREPCDWDDILEDARSAADTSNWQRYIEVMGGAFCPRELRPVQLAKTVSEQANQYGEDVIKIMGVLSSESHTPLHTRLEGWQISRYGLGHEGDTALPSGDSRAPWSSDNNCTQGSKDQKRIGKLEQEAAKLGLEPEDLALLRHGSVINSGGVLIRLRDNMLLVSKASVAESERADDWSTMDSHFDAAVKHHHQQWRKQLREQAWQLLQHGGDVEQWIAGLPNPDTQRLALEQLADVIELERIERRQQQHAERQYQQQQFWEDIEEDEPF